MKCVFVRVSLIYTTERVHIHSSRTDGLKADESPVCVNSDDIEYSDDIHVLAQRYNLS